jgi:peptidoglycan/xylan/chitin deacetylase (PgdA/CDA1 family)
MYHYVRQARPDLPHLPYLDVANFRRQLDYFEATYGIVDRDSFESWLEGGDAPAGVVLTFDDGLRDHIDVVLPVIKERGLFALFYACSLPILTERILDVHKVHLAVGRIGGDAALSWLRSKSPDCLPAERIDAEPKVYAEQKSDRATKLIKHAFNWTPANETKSAALDGLLDFAFEGHPPHWTEIYMTDAELRALLDAGMGVGPHSHAHRVPALLDPDEQRDEVARSCDFISAVAGGCTWGYCYPHGIAQALSPNSETIVAESGCSLAFAVAPEDILDPLVHSRRFSLPRHNCNAFPHGTASYG